MTEFTSGLRMAIGGSDMFDVLKWIVYGLVLVVLLPYTAIAVAGMVMGVYRQFKPHSAQSEKGDPREREKS